MVIEGDSGKSREGFSSLSSLHEIRLKINTKVVSTILDNFNPLAELN